MEVVKEYLLAKYFGRFGYIVAAFHLPAFLIFSAYTGHFRTSERRTLRCPSFPDSREYCLRKYDEKYNSPFPLWGFVMFCFVPLVVICISYSWCFVKSRVDELETALKPDPENPRRRPRLRTRRVFRYYLSHLSLRFCFGILCVLLQKFVFYPSGFPSEFTCVHCAINCTSNATKDHSSAIDCYNPVASDTEDVAMGIWIVNLVFALLVLGEICFLMFQATRNKEFSFDSEFCQKHFFDMGGPLIATREAMFRMKTRKLEETELYQPLIVYSEGNEDRLLDDMFVDLVIYTGRARHEFENKMKRHEIHEIYLKPQGESIAIERIDELFLPNNDTENPCKILVVGRPGIGKSLLCTKLLREWSKGGLLRDSDKNFDYLYLFQFRWFNTETDKISLIELLSRSLPEGVNHDDLIQHVLENPDKVILVFDGLDEFKYHADCLAHEQVLAGNKVTERLSLSALYVKLVNGDLLSGATILTTSRPTVLQSVAHIKFDRKVEIMGFTPQKVHKYIQNFCAQDEDRGNKIWDHISSNPELLSLCYIPVNSHIICSILEECIKLQEQNALPTTPTEVYEKALRLFIFKHHPEFRGQPLTEDFLINMGNSKLPDTVEDALNKAGSLAKAGIEKGQLVFESQEVQGVEECGLFNKMPNKKLQYGTFKSQFSFIHLTFQEFLAAREIAQMNPSELSDFVKANVRDPKWHLVLQFVAGLLCRKQTEAVNTFISILVDWPSKEEALLMLKCLHEYNDEATVRQAASELQKNTKLDNSISFFGCQVTPVDCVAILYFIKHLQSPTSLNLERNSVTNQGVSLLCDALKDEHCKLTGLNLAQNKITDQGVSLLCDALKDEHCKLTELNLDNNDITNQGVSLLCDALKNEHCKLTKLNLNKNNIADKDVPLLCDALKDEHCKLTELNLHWNHIKDQGVSFLCDALKDEHCKLTKLNLGWNNITEEGVSHLCDALKDEHCKLTKLELARNEITDQGVPPLCDALKDEHCKLTELNLDNNDITNQVVSLLCDALKDELCRLTELSLGWNNITEEGVSHLCDALKDEHCKLTKLKLFGNKITDQGVPPLCDALKDEHCKLTELDLARNNVTDQGVSLLCDALKDEHCKLTELDLARNKVTDQGVSLLCDALKDEHCKLTKLHLAMNEITDQGVSLLCDALKDEHCKLTELSLNEDKSTGIVRSLSHIFDAVKNGHCNVHFKAGMGSTPLSISF